jgi:hypothetical protein
MLNDWFVVTNGGLEPGLLPLSHHTSLPCTILHLSECHSPDINTHFYGVN